MALDTSLDFVRSIQVRRLRIVLVALGGVALMLGLFTLVAPETAGRLPIASILERFRYDWVAVAIFGVVALVGVFGVVLARALAGITQTTLPTPEDVHQGAQIGATFDEFLSAADLHSWLFTERYQEVRSRLRAAAIDTVIRESNCTRSEAQERVDSGRWTDNEMAASFLAEPVELTFTARFWAGLRGDSTFQRAARTTAAEIAHLDPEAER